MLYEAKALKLAVNKFEVEAQVIWCYDVLLLNLLEAKCSLLQNL